MKLFAIFLALTLSCLAVDAPAGKTVVLTASVGTGTAPISYTWFKDGQKFIPPMPAVETATSSVITLKNVQASDAGSYMVNAWNPAGGSNSPESVLTVSAVVAAPVFTLQPVSKTVVSGNSVSFSALATGATSYQWLKNGTAIAGAVSANFAIAGATGADVGTYSVRAINASGTTTSNGATLTVSTPVLVPAGGASVTITVSP